MDKINVLDCGYVELLDVMPSQKTWEGEMSACDQAVVQAARVSFDEQSKGLDKDIRLIQYMAKNFHTSPFEMVEFKFRLYIPLVAKIQLLRHRTANINSISYRYMELEEKNDFYIPEEWRLQSKDNKQGSSGQLDSESSKLLSDFLEAHVEASEMFYKRAINLGVAKEMARLFLPAYSLYYNIVWKMDLNNLSKFAFLRTDSHAQQELRVYAQAIWSIAKKYAPVSCEALESSWATHK